MQPPGLMKMRWMHHQEHHQDGHQNIITSHDVLCNPHNVTLPHESCMVILAGLNKAGYRARTHCMAGHSNTRCRSSMKSRKVRGVLMALFLAIQYCWAWRCVLMRVLT